MLNKKYVVSILIFACPLSYAAMTNNLLCPAGYEGPSADVHHNDAYATSAPEVKLAAASQKNNPVHWHRLIHPLITKALDQAKAKRAADIEEGIENACSAKEQYVSQIVPYEDHASGCDYRIVTRPADSEHVWVQAVAFCKYDWNCCRAPEVAVPSHPTTAAGSAGYTLEGSVAPTGSAGTATSTHTVTGAIKK